MFGLLLLAGCNGRENFLVRVTFPDDTARGQTRSLRVVVVEPAENASCDALKGGRVVPGDVGYVIENQASFFLPAPGDGEPLGEVGAGRRLFYADAEDEGGEVFLRGCTEVQVGERESHLVIIALEWVSKPCEGDPDCDDSNDCTTDRCEESECVNEAALDGTDCGVCAACDGQGVCIEDLTQDGDCALCQECTTGGGCVNQAAGSNVKGECADGLFCNGLETCDGSGGCQAGSDPCPGTECNTCQEDTDACLDPAGTSCDDGDSCSSQDGCDGSGSCVSGATDKDTDGDGYYDEACPGGDDCDDGAISINPGVVEGPNGDPTCSDGLDNDCDGLTDDCSAQEGYRKRITIDPTQVNGLSDLSDFPVLISIPGDNDLRTTANGGHVENPNGYDITFRASDGATQLDHEVEEYNSTSGTLVAWVRIPLLSASADTIIYVYYGYSGVTSPTENPASVWDNDHVGVWHLKEDAAGTGTGNLYIDSTANANHGDDFVSATGQDGQINGGQAFDGVDDYIDCGNSSSLDVGYLTVEFWLNVNSWVNDGGILAKGDNSYRQYWVWTYGGEVAFEIDEGGNINYAWTPASGQWEHLAIIYDGADVITYRNGAQENIYPQATGAIDAATPPLLLGRIPSFNYADVALDELRISNIARSADWIGTGYNNQNSPSGFYSVGNEETP